MSNSIFLETVTGKMVDVTNPTADQISIEDIAWGLSRISRFCGMTITEIPYNVAQHSIFVANEIVNLLPSHLDLRRVMMLGLLHDASEVYTGDLPSPIKQIPELRPIIKGIEHKLMDAVYQSVKLDPPTDEEEIIIKQADRIAQKIEAHSFMQSRGKNWPNMPEVSLEKLQQFKSPKPSLDSYNEFMQMFNKLHK
jgi:5'-deoxynucleotidase YfbR-like HD superfamily hydrolase